MNSQTYAVPASSELSGSRFEAQVVADDVVPRVRAVTIRSWSWGTASPEVVLHFDPDGLTQGPGSPFILYFTCTGADAGGRRLLLSDDSGELESFAHLAADSTVQGGGDAEEWKNIGDVVIRVMFGTAH